MDTQSLWEENTESQISKKTQNPRKIKTILISKYTQKIPRKLTQNRNK